MSAEYFPITGLRLTTPRLELAPPTAERLDELASRGTPCDAGRWSSNGCG